MTTDEWVHRLNGLARKMDEWAVVIHPSTWAIDPYLIKLKEQFRKLAKVEIKDDDKPKPTN